MPAWIREGNTAVVTGGASGIGLEAARRYAAAGMNVAIVDKDDTALGNAIEELAKVAGSADRIFSRQCDVSEFSQVEETRDAVLAKFGAVHCLMNNAGAGFMVGAPWENLTELNDTLTINLFGIIHGCHAFIPSMLENDSVGAIINTGSKQGITRPPGNYAYNLSKAGVLAYTESVANAFTQIDQCKLSAHLLVPGFVYTPMISRHIPEKPPFAWTAAQTIDFMLPCLDNDDFYIICPDGEATREIDEKRIQWNVDDIIKNRPALSRWHPDFKEQFADFLED